MWKDCCRRPRKAKSISKKCRWRPFYYCTWEGQESGSSCNKQTKENVHLLKKWVEIESESDTKRLNMQWSSKIVVLPCNASSGSEQVVLLSKTTLQQMLYLHIRSNSTFNQKSTFFSLLCYNISSHVQTRISNLLHRSDKIWHIYVHIYTAHQY